MPGTVTVPGTATILWWLIGFGDEVEALEPPELRTCFVEVAANMARAYAVICLMENAIKLRSFFASLFVISAHPPFELKCFLPSHFYLS